MTTAYNDAQEARTVLLVDDDGYAQYVRPSDAAQLGRPIDQYMVATARDILDAIHADGLAITGSCAADTYDLLYYVLGM